MKIISLPALTAPLLKQLEQLIGECGGYTPFFHTADESGHTGIMQYAAFDCNNVMTGFLSCLILPSDLPDIRYEAEITALVTPQFRRRGIFSRMFSRMKQSVLPSDTHFICAVPPVFFPHRSDTFSALGEHLTQACAAQEPRFVTSRAYTEFLLKLESSSVDHTRPEPFSTGNVPPCECYFTEDETEYLLYLSDEDEPAAVCSLDYQPSFTSLYGVYVEQARRKKGFGTLLLYHLIQDYFDGCALPLILNVRSTNTAALRLYKKCGFIEESRIDYYFL